MSEKRSAISIYTHTQTHIQHFVNIVFLYIIFLQLNQEMTWKIIRVNKFFTKKKKNGKCSEK